MSSIERLLRWERDGWLSGSLRPLSRWSKLNCDWGAVEEFVATSTSKYIRDHLSDVYDIERLTARVATGRCSPRDLRNSVNRCRSYLG